MSSQTHFHEYETYVMEGVLMDVFQLDQHVSLMPTGCTDLVYHSRVFLLSKTAYESHCATN